jgi:hypothetical protein
MAFWICGIWDMGIGNEVNVCKMEERNEELREKKKRNTRYARDAGNAKGDLYHCLVGVLSVNKYIGSWYEMNVFKTLTVSHLSCFDCCNIAWLKTLNKLELSCLHHHTRYNAYIAEME